MHYFKKCIIVQILPCLLASNALHNLLVPVFLTLTLFRGIVIFYLSRCQGKKCCVPGFDKLRTSTYLIWPKFIWIQQGRTIYDIFLKCLALTALPPKQCACISYCSLIRKMLERSCCSHRRLTFIIFFLMIRWSHIL